MSHSGSDDSASGESTSSEFELEQDNNSDPPFHGELCDSQDNFNGYKLLVTINAYGVPTNRCAECNKWCDTDCSVGCDTYFNMCMRPFMSPEPADVQMIGESCPASRQLQTTMIDKNSNGFIFKSMVLGIPNPIQFTDIVDVSIKYTL